MNIQNHNKPNYSAFPQVYERSKLKDRHYLRGKIIVKGFPDSRDPWRKHGINGFEFPLFREIYGGCIRTPRSGFIIIWAPDNGEPKILIIREKDRVVIDDEKYSFATNGIVPGLYGFPKGAADYRTDTSIMDTAFRECREEVGVQLTYNDIVWPALVYERPEVSEVFVYFVTIYKERPKLKISYDELAGAEWMMLSEIDKIKCRMSNPTRAIMSVLARFDLTGVDDETRPTD